MKPLTRIAAAAACSAALAAVPGRAQTVADQTAAAETAGQSVTDIVVTSNKRSELLKDVPASVTALTGQELSYQNVDDFSRLALTVPGLTENTLVRNRAIFDVRGVSTSLFGGNTQDPVAVYINDTLVTDTFGAAVQPDLRLFDVDRVEVLRGPQGTLYGSGALAGVVRILTNQPRADKFEAAVRADEAVTDGGYLRQRYDGMVNIPIVENELAVRAVVYYRDEQGWVLNKQLGTDNGTVDEGGRVALLWTPSDATKLALTAIYQKSDPSDGDSWNPANGLFNKSSVLPEGRRLQFQNYNATFEQRFPGLFTFTSSTSYQLDQTALYADGGAIPGLGEFITKDVPWRTQILTEEARLVSDTAGPLTWTAGLFLTKRDNKITFLDQLTGLSAILPGPLAAQNIYYLTYGGNHSKELAGYADFTYAIPGGFKLFGGVRPFTTDASYRNSGQQLSAATFTYIPVTQNSSSANHDVTWRAGASYQPNPDLLVYGSVSTGFRIGQANPVSGPSAVNPRDTVIPAGYQPDTTTNYEIGTKATLFGGRLQANASLFYIDWNNIQLNFQRLSDFAAYVGNGGQAVSEGAELELVGRPFRGWQAGGALTLQDAHISSISATDSARTGVRNGDRLPGAVRYKGSTYLQYDAELADDAEGFARLSASFQGDSPNFFANTPNGPNPTFALNQNYEDVDVIVGVVKGRWEVDVYGENLTNDRRYILNEGPAVKNPVTTLRPVTAGVRVTFRY